MPTVYVASKSRHHAWWRALRAAGVPIWASWIDWPPNLDGSEPTPDAWAAHWHKCIAEAADADVLLFVDMPGENQCGALAEMGAALAHGRQVFLVSENWWSIEHHIRVRKFMTLGDAVAAIVAQQAGERARSIAKENRPAGEAERSNYLGG